MVMEVLPNPDGLGRVLEGSDLSVFWVLPFFGVLLSLAAGPSLLRRQVWNTYYGRIMGLWSILTSLVMVWAFGPELAARVMLIVMICHYAPFIVLITALYGISSKIAVTLEFRATAHFNTLFMALATCAASCLGTTGASILFIRPLLKANAWRYHRRHLVVFFIFLVANIGGSLTPMGDPPLFLGFLHGISFLWVTHHMLLPMIACSVPILIMFYCLDLHLVRQEKNCHRCERIISDGFSWSKIKIRDKTSFLLLLGVIGSVVLSGIWTPGVNMSVCGIKVAIQDLVRDVFILFCLLLALSRKGGREYNWGPVLEVIQVFGALFITAAPVMSILEAGSQGAFFKFILFINDQDQYLTTLYFWGSGILSAFLDNAPTYLAFFHLASGDPEIMMGPRESILISLSLGSVFMGACTYIGNAPNLLVKSIAEASHVQMPGFFGYMGWAATVIVPLFLLVGILFL